MKTKTPRIALACLIAGIGLLCGGAQAQIITEFTAGISPGAAPTAITAGPCGDGVNRCLWFTEEGLDRIGRITLDGTVTEFAAGISAGAQLFLIVEGPDGNLWFIEEALSRIGRINPATGAVTEFSVPDPNVFQIGGITPGPDGNLWFTTYALGGTGSIARIVPTTGAITLFSAGISIGSQPFGITAGPDGNLWFTEYGQGITDIPAKIGSFTLGGAVGTVTEFGGIGFNAGPSSITAGPDGKLWFNEVTLNRIARIDSTGTGPDPNDPNKNIPVVNVTEVSDQISFKGGAGEMTAGPDGNLWFTEVATNQVGRITPAGTVTLFGSGLNLVQPFGITTGPDGNLWFTEGGDRIGRITLGPNTPVGSNVEVDLGGGTGAAGGVSVTFAQVSGAGNTVVTASGSCPALPSVFALGTPAVCDEVTTTASYTPPVQVCINYSGISFGSASIALLHYDGSAWVDVTTALDSANHIVCGSVNSLSPFAVAAHVSSGTTRTTTTIASSVNPTTLGQAVIFTASVAGNFPTGTVQFMDARGDLGSPVTLSGGGIAQLVTSTLTRGSHRIKAIYSGDSNNTPSTSAALHQRVQGPKGHAN